MPSGAGPCPVPATRLPEARTLAVGLRRRALALAGRVAGAAAAVIACSLAAAAPPTVIDTPDAASLRPSAARLPPPAQLEFELQRGALRGQAQWLWQPGPGSYTLSLQATALGMTVLSWHSRGRVDATGIVPERFTDRRRGRDEHRADFDREQGRVRYSDGSADQPWRAGMQDRLSWMAQLPGIATAATVPWAVGSRVPMFVTGARGDAQLWTFAVTAIEPLELPSGRVDAAMHLLRLPRKPQDARVEIWLDPSRHHLPVRIVMGSFDDGDAQVFALTRMTVGP